MTYWDRNYPDDGDTDLDQWIKRGLDAELTRMDADFDFEAGLADVYSRAGLTRPEAADPRNHAATHPPNSAATSRGTPLRRAQSRPWSTTLRCSMPC